MHTCISSHGLKRSWRSCPRRVNAGNKNTPSTHHPRRRNVTTLMVGLKKKKKTVTYAKISLKSGEPQRYSWGTKKKKKKKWSLLWQWDPVDCCLLLSRITGTITVSGFGFSLYVFFCLLPVSLLILHLIILCLFACLFSWIRLPNFRLMRLGHQPLLLSCYSSSHSSCAFPARSLGSPFGVKCLQMWPFLSFFSSFFFFLLCFKYFKHKGSHILSEDGACWVCFRCCLSRMWMSGSFESVWWNTFMHRLDLGLYCHPKVWGVEPEPRLSPREKWPQPGGSEESQGHNTASCRVVSPVCCHLNFLGPKAESSKCISLDVQLCIS